MSRPEGFAPIPTWMLRDKTVPRNAILVYASLSSRSGLGAIFPSQATIAEEAGLSERTVRRMMTHLEEIGVVERRARRGGEGRANSKTDAYTLHPNGRIEGSAKMAGRSERPDKSDERPDTEDRATGQELQATPLIEAEIEEADRAEAAPRKRGTRIPEPFLLTAEMRAWAASEVPGLDVDAHTREFVDYWRAEAGAKATKLDWLSTWRNWMRKAHRWNGPKTHRPTPDDRVRDGLDRGARVAALIGQEALV